MIDVPVVKDRNITSVVGLEGVSLDNAVRQDLLFDDRQQSLGPGIGDDVGKDLVSALLRWPNTATLPPASRPLLLLCLPPK